MTENMKKMQEMINEGKEEKTLENNTYNWTTKRSVTIVDYCREMYDGISVRIPVIDGVKRNDLAIGAVSDEDAEDAIKFLSIAIEATGNIMVARQYIMTYQTWALNNRKVDDIIIVDNIQLPYDSKNAIVYDLTGKVIANLDELSKDEKSKLGELAKTILSAKVSQYKNDHTNWKAYDKVETQSDITTKTRIPLSEYLCICLSNYVTAAPTIDGKVEYNMICTTRDQSRLDANMKMWQKALEVCGDPGKATRLMHTAVVLKDNNFKPDEITEVTINGCKHQVMIDTTNDKLMIEGILSIITLEDLDTTNMSKEAKIEILKERAKTTLTR